ncbi:hypothetical protein B0H13DRAFT_1897718 [Mycena leptocephala]|nr:hypothetical protein B0H13DRAFT_1897718 [Mycena leptocephala]
MNNEKAMMLTTKGCLIAFLNKLFGNSTPGSNLDCIALPRHLPCSNCLPRFSGTLVFEPSPLPSGPERLRPFSAPQPKPVTAAPYRPKTNKLTRKMRSAADAELRKFRVKVQKLERDYDVYGCTPPSSYLSNSVIASLLDTLLISGLGRFLLRRYRDGNITNDMAKRFLRSFCLFRSNLQVFEAARLERNQKARQKRRAAAGKDVMSEDEVDMDEDPGSEDEDVDDSTEELVSLPPELLTRKRQALSDATNIPRPSKRVRATREPLKSVGDTLESYGPKYRPRIRRSNAEN